VRSQPPVSPIQNNQQQQQQKPIDGKPEGQDPVVTSEPQLPDSTFIGREQRVEYRDENGNVLDAELVSMLSKEGKVSLQTRYQTQTRVIDADGNEIIKHVHAGEHAPPHPDVEGQNPETNRKGNNGEESVARNEPASAAGSEKSVYDEKEASAAKPASENQAATQ
jgi:dolichyl-phosphate-mannose-protein mannosyltransferase